MRNSSEWTYTHRDPKASVATTDPGTATAYRNAAGVARLTRARHEGQVPDPGALHELAERARSRECGDPGTSSLEPVAGAKPLRDQRH